MPIDIAGGLTAIKSGFDVAKSIGELVKGEKIDAGEVSSQLLLLKSLMLDSQEALNSAVEENRELRNRIEELQRVGEIGKEFQFEEGVYWYRKYPYCPNCWDVDRNPIRLDGPFASRSVVEHKWSCPVHKSVYYLRPRT